MGIIEISSKYQLGQIIELKVQKILTESQIVIFDLDGVSARLHVANISNSADLSRKLFNLICLGETITSVIIGFNAEKQYVELSLKPFRNQLEGSLSFFKCRNIIDARRDMRANLPLDILQENRNQLDRIQGDLAKVDLTFLYELIQNAIDHPNKEFNNQVNIKFEVYNDYLLLKHNGNIFTENNFRSLTGILLGEEETGETRIGYKGIGFKSIFRYTHEVYIRSGNFSFSFSKDRTGAKLPWEVIPIFENEIEKVDEIKNFEFFNTPVAFAFKFTNPELKAQAIQYLEQLVASPETLLFLDKLNRLEIVVDDKVNRIIREVVKCDNFEKVNLQLNDELPQEWLICQESNTITDELILKELKDENNPSIPLKFRNFNTPQIQIAFPLLQDKDLINMYAYLPLSEMKCGLPFLLNGDFIPNLDRTDLIRNLKYNYSLAQLGAKVLSKLFKIVSKEYGIDRALLLISKFDDSRDDFFKRLNESFVSIKDELRITLNTNVEVPLKNFVIDRSGLFSIINPKEIQAIDFFKESYVFGKMSTNTEQYLIDKIGLKVFTTSHGVQLLVNKEIISNYFSSFSKLIIFLFRISRLNNNSDWSNRIPTLKLLKNGDEFFALSDFYIGVPYGFEDLFRTVLKISALKREDSLLIENKNCIAALLVKFGLKQFNLSDVLRQLDNLSPKQKSEISKNNLDLIWQFLYLNREVKNNDGSKLVNDRFKLFPINTIDDNSEELENCFAGDLEETDSNFSYLYENYGKEKLYKVNIANISKLTGVGNKDVIEFLKSIHESIKITDKALFKNAFKTICSLPKNELEIKKENLVKALISVYHFNQKYSNVNLFELGMMTFPVITTTNTIENISFTYFDKNYSSFIDNEELYAEDLFKNVEDIPFLSIEYLNECPEIEKKKFVDFLRLYYVSPGIKLINSNSIRNKEVVKMSSVDYVFSNWYPGYGQIRSQNTFLIPRDVQKIANNYSNLVVFWSKLSTIKDISILVNDIQISNSNHPNPFIWLLRRTKQFCPMQDGTTKSFSEIHNKELLPFSLSLSDKLHTCITEKVEKIFEKLSSKTYLSNEAIIKCLQNLNQIPNDKIEILMLQHFAKSKFTEEEINQIKSSCYLIAKDKSIQKANELIYLEKSIELASHIINQALFLESKIMHTFEYNYHFKNIITQLKLNKKGIEDIEVISFDVLESTNDDSIKTKIIDFASGLIKQQTDLLFLNESKFVLCNQIIIGFKDLTDYNTQVDSFYTKESNIFYFTEIRELIELLCEKFNWPLSENRKLRKILDKKEEAEQVKKAIKNDTKKIEFNEEEISQIKKLFGRELDENELMEENLFAQVKALRYFKDNDYNVTQAEEQFTANYKDKYLNPIIDSEGNASKVMCRSARKGILFLGAYAWKNLGEQKTLLFILTGDKSTDNIIVNTQHELEEKLHSYYKVIRRVNTTVEDISTLVESETNLKDLQFLYKVKSGDYDLIFNPKQNNPGESGGALTDIGVDDI